MKVKFKKLCPEAVTPSYSKIGDAGLDLTAVTSHQSDDYIEYGTGIAIEIPENHVGLLFPRSSITQRELILKNSVGVIDSNFRGEIKLRFKGFLFTEYFTKKYYRTYTIGERIGQLVIVPIPTIELEESDELSQTVRGANGYGSTGN